MEVKNYTNLNEISIQNCLMRPSESFYIDEMNQEELDTVSRAKLTEYKFDGVNNIRLQQYYDSKYAYFKEKVCDIIYTNDIGKLYTIQFQHLPTSKSRIKWHKGVEHMKLFAGGSYCQYELDIEKGMSIIAASVEVDRNALFNIFDFILDDSVCFILRTSDNDLVSKIINRYRSVLIIKGNVRINFAQILCEMRKCDELYRLGGDGGDTFWSLQHYYFS